MNTTKMNKESALSIQEQWSLLMDGELSEQELDELLAQCDGQDSLMMDWSTYHVIGDVLRSNDLAQAHVTLATGTFLSEFRARLQREPLLVAPTALAQPAKKQGLRLQWPQWTGWLAASGFVVLAVVGVVYTSQEGDIWTQQVAAVAPTEESRQPSILQQASAWAVASAMPARAALVGRVQNVGVQSLSEQAADIRLDVTPQGRVWRDPRFDPYISAHQQFGNGSALNIPANGYMRSSAVAEGSNP